MHSFYCEDFKFNIYNLRPAEITILSTMVQPKKHLGQHFLTDPAIAKRIADLLPDDPSMNIMEIGPGTGILTRQLFGKECENLILVEIDRESVDYLYDNFPGQKFKLLSQDFLKMDESEFQVNNLHIIGNFPYNISSQIFFRVLEHRERVQSVTCMIQKEVAERIVSPPGSKVYGILSVLLQAYYTPKMQFQVKPGSFYPPPKVTSSVITLKRNDVDNLGCDEKLFTRIVKATFNQRRKTIRNSLKTILLNLDDSSDLLSKRPEQLGVQEFIELTRWVQLRI